ncbi:aspartate--tRNA ligase [bacterium Unc6]|nr:aspartate--tRNA ligase [bacterium Unc6]
MKRTHTCADINERNVETEVCLAGWVNSRRDHGGLLFIDLRDRSGIIQLVINPKQNKIAEGLRNEYVVYVKGSVQKRPPGTENPKILTGNIEINVKELKILNDSQILPFEISDNLNVSEDLRLQYRFLDLRRPCMQKKIITRHKIVQYIRKYLEKKGFIEIETPILTLSTPEGARDYLVPSRVNPGKFYALPQSPQLFKQILMVSGFEKYYQIARCFRDEDLRADRQPEFTQIDMEMSFVDENDVMNMTEELLREIFSKVSNINLPEPFPIISYKDAMERFGTDKPDLRFKYEIKNLTDILKDTEFKVFKTIVDVKGSIRAICVKCDLSRSQIDEITQAAKGFGASGLVWFKIKQEQIESPVVKFLKEESLKKIIELFDAKQGDMIFVMAGKEPDVLHWIGRLRCYIAEKIGIIPEGIFKPVWVTESPMFFYNTEERRWEAEHHPFTAPKEEDIALLDKEPSKVRSRAYDVIINGLEVGGGSIRIHNRDLQEKIFRLLGIDKETARLRFGFLLNAFAYGAPPHGGIAPGLDRLVRLITGDDNIREVIAFPKTQKAICLMTEAPSEVSQGQLKELHINIVDSYMKFGSD